MELQVEALVKNYAMLPHPEGGWYKENYRSNRNIPLDENSRSLLTSIYFLLTSENVSRFHVLKSDELWYYHSGSALTVHCISPKGEYYQLKIGPNFEAGEQFQAVVPSGTIFGSTVDQKNQYAMVGCAVAPGFDFEDFKLFTTAELLAKFPSHQTIIQKLT
ncbi:cupin [Putridiphycobacter roseus]|uniref:Cupin n=1 Tax=Putridiphycobacter roseus TaxID=2219161 RepID=A0A2W1N409_9FLAO|nr:cupin domain-containing protein [Putridiphycobacter roseus]PZE18330.1 cupin [Putridiphycobacter roseus]